MKETWCDHLYEFPTLSPD